jgi:hypothetical protein
MSEITVTENVNQVLVSTSPTVANVTAGFSPDAAHATYTHSQSSPSSTWTIVHNLNCRPAVTIVDSAGNVQIGEVLYVSDNAITVSFVSAFGGYAYLN